LRSWSLKVYVRFLVVGGVMMGLAYLLTALRYRI